MGRRAGACGVATALALALTAGACTTDADREDPPCAESASQLSSYDATTGSVRWTLALDHPYDDPPTWPGNHLVLTGCGVVAVDPDHGRIAMRRRDATGFIGYSGGYLMTLRDGVVRAEPVEAPGGGRSWASTPSYDGAAVLANLLFLHRGTTVTVYETGSGERKWQFDLPTLGGHPTFHLGYGLLVVHATDGSVYGLVLSDTAAEVRWRAIPVAPHLGYGAVLEVTPRALITFVGHGEGTELVALDVTTGSHLWRVAVPGLEREPVAVADEGVLAVPTRDLDPGRTGITGLGLSDGRVRWRTRATDGEGLVGTTGAFATPDGMSVVAFDARTGAQIWRVPTANPPLLTAGGVVGIVVLDSPPVPHIIDDCC